MSTSLHNRQDILYTPSLITKVLVASSLRNSFTTRLQTTQTEREDYVIGVTAAFSSSLTANKTRTLIVCFSCVYCSPIKRLTITQLNADGIVMGIGCQRRREKKGENNWIKLFGNRTMRSFYNLFVVIGASVSHALNPPPPPKVHCTYKTMSRTMDRTRRLVNFK